MRRLRNRLVAYALISRLEHKTKTTKRYPEEDICQGETGEGPNALPEEMEQILLKHKEWQPAEEIEKDKSYIYRLQIYWRIPQ